MEIKKGTEIMEGGAPTAAQLEAINTYARAALKPEQVYVFSLRLCDDQEDRDGERFDTAALPALARLFLGKTGIVDHCWSAENQVARIFETQVVRAGDVSYIKAWAYIRRSEANADIIADIEAGIKKEVSVGCAMGRAVCSVCGGEYGACGHVKGEYYDGQKCCVILKEPVDAYEFSFVAVPAQREAGVMKGAGRKACLKELADRFGAQEEYQALYKRAELGDRYRQDLEKDVVRLFLTLDFGLEEPDLRHMFRAFTAEDLRLMRRALEIRVEEMLPAMPQLRGLSREETLESGFLI